MTRMKKNNYIDQLNIAATEQCRPFFDTDRTIVDAYKSDFVDVAAVVVGDNDVDIINKVDAQKFNIPIFVISQGDSDLSADVMAKIYHIIDINVESDRRLYDREIEAAATKYENQILPPFFKALKEYVERGNIQFDCPGHQGGNISVNIQQVNNYITFLVKMFLEQIFATLMWL